MKILIIGPLGAGKSSLAYAINQKFGLPRLNLDEVCRTNNTYRSEAEQLKLLTAFIQKHSCWVMECCQKALYEKACPDVIIDMRIGRLRAVWRFTKRFFEAKKLIDRDISPDLPVQSYHYRKVTIGKIFEWDKSNGEIMAQIADFLKGNARVVITCKSFKDHKKVFEYITHNNLSGM